MAKLKAPLFSLGASGQLGKALVFFGWKGLDVVREYVIPSNPQTKPQTDQRGYLTAAVAAVHTAQANTLPLDETDTMAYSLWASIVKAATTWFNQAVKNFIDQLAAIPARTGIIFWKGTTTPGTKELYVEIRQIEGVTTDGVFKYGTSKTALLRSEDAGYARADTPDATINGLTTGVKYFWQYVPSEPAGAIGAKSGIYYGVPL